MMETPDCAKIQKLIQYIEGLNRQKKKHDGYRDAVIKRVEDGTLPVEQQAKLDQDWPERIKRNWNGRVQPLIDSIKRYIEDVWPEIIANGSGKWSVSAFKDMLDAGLNDYKECEKSGYIDEPIKELKIVLEKLKQPGSGGNAGDTKKQVKLSKEQQALAVLVKHPDWTNKQIADEIGAHEKSLSRWSIFQKAKEAQKTVRKDFPEGSKDGQTGDLEAWEQ
jgi:hypothetical protein